MEHNSPYSYFVSDAKHSFKKAAIYGTASIGTLSIIDFLPNTTLISAAALGTLGVLGFKAATHFQTGCDNLNKALNYAEAKKSADEDLVFAKKVTNLALDNRHPKSQDLFHYKPVLMPNPA